MGGRRAQFAAAGAGGVAGAAGAALAGASVAWLAAGVVIGAALALTIDHPEAAWAIAAAALIAVVPTGEQIPDPLLVFVLAHIFLAGRWDGGVLSALALVLLAAPMIAVAAVTSGEGVPYIFLPMAAWGAGKALGDRERVAAQLALRARELEEEREAHAELSVRYERARIASELHDIVAHAISVMVVQASAGQRLTERDPERTEETFEAIAGAARQAEADMGRLVALLGDEDAIGPAPDLQLLDELVARASGSGLDVTLRLDGDREGLPAEVVATVYRVVQEGLTNALRYASGAPVSVRVSRRRDELEVEVRNSRTGAEPTLAGSGTGTGLRGLRERVAGQGGSLTAGPVSDGWSLIARLPIRSLAGNG